ncbi:MAG: hypothetical protein ABJC13_01390 [Acidobacteriota bacterium]
MDPPSTLGRLAPPLVPEGLADAPTSLPARSPFFRLAWRSMELAERAAVTGDLARAEEAFLIAAHGFGNSGLPWLEGLATLALAAVYRLEGFDLPDWIVDRPSALTVAPDVADLFLDILVLIDITPPDSHFLWELLADVRAHRKGLERSA